ncbi:GLPGLI family protein [uncultured Tenacibaculum sp.]|uniref:GLPGLI family protein n=1 Tax=uncultured Tenacibaculum sp. TaxID=174713 RepID=UPI00260A7BF7|nr:GLPGLI family protein [uncultured Tenacibaculum sp.]
MKNNLLFFICITLSLNIWSQNNIQGIVTYQKEKLNAIYTEDKKEKLGVKKYTKFSKLEKTTKKAHKSLKFYLKFNEQKSLFNVQDLMNTPKDKFLKFSIGSEGKGIYYNSVTERLREKNTFGEVFIIKYNRLKWELKNTSKKIGNYTCFKAETIEKVKTRNGFKEYKIEAWYAPEINVSFGPIGFSGTPGLILELERNGIKYFATSITLNPQKEVIVNKPNKGKVITEEQYRNMLIKARKEFKEL